MATQKLRVGLLLDDLEVSAWSARMFEEIMVSDCAEICLVVINGAKPEVVQKGLVEKVTSNIGRLGSVLTFKSMDLLYRRVVDKQPGLADAQRTVNVQTLLSEVPRLTVMPRQSQWSDVVPEDDLEQIRSHDLDVLVRCGFRILRGGILGAAKHGVWSYHHGDNRVNRGGPPGFWESLESWPDTGSVLQILTEDLDNGHVLYRSWSCTYPFSLQDNRSNYYWKTLSFIPRKLRELHRDGPDRFFERVAEENRHPEMYSRRLYTKPTATEFARLTLAKVWDKLRGLIERQFYFEQWVLLFSLRDRFSSSLWRYEKILPPRDRFWADPHVIQRDGRYYVYIEEYLYATQRGHISLIEMDEEGNWTQPVAVLERPYHLSYPFVFEYEGELYMIPETASNRTIELYRCVEFPHRWEFQRNLMENVYAVDATLLERDGRWWLFANLREIDGASSWDELFVFHAEDFRTAAWTAHPRNPVVSDCKRSRPAGAFFEIDGRLYRPSQNCSVRYGYGFNFSEVNVLTETEYEESVVTTVEPDWERDLRGTHTFNAAGRLHLSDAYLRRRKKGR